MGSASFLHYPTAQPTEIHHWWLFRANGLRRGVEVVFSAAVRSPSMALARNLMQARLEGQQIVLQRETGLALTDCQIDADLVLATSAQSLGQDMQIGALGLASARDAASLLPHLEAPDISSLPGLAPRAPGGASADEPAMPAAADAVFFDHPSRPDGLKDSVYAVIDGAKVFALAEQLAGSGLRHACLFQGRAETESGAVAPWLVQLERHHRLTRQLFTQQKPDSGRPCLWTDGAAIFLRSPLAFEGLRAHLRRFTMVIDEGRNARLYFRFYDPVTVRTILSQMAPEKLGRMLTGIACLLAPDAEGPATLIRNLPRPAPTT